jgi:hypothetical protein
MLTVETIRKIRLAIHRDGKTIRETVRDLGVSRNTVRKVKLTQFLLGGISMQHSVFSEMVSGWASPIVAREEIHRFTGGTITPHYMANLDSKGLGPTNRFRCGRKVFYPVADFVRWLSARSEPIPAKTPRELESL